MGGHGGLNILPQKSWHVYRHDNIARVRRDEVEFAKENQKKRLFSAKNEFRRKVIDIQRKNLDLGNKNINDNSSSLKKCNAELNTIGCDDPEKPCGFDFNYDFSKERRSKKSINLTSRKKRINDCSILEDKESQSSLRLKSECDDSNLKAKKNINFFAEEEKILLQKEKKHDNYLSKVGHKSHDGKVQNISGFDLCKKDLRSTWYTGLFLPSEIRYNEHTNHIQNDTNDHPRNESQEDLKYRNDVAPSLLSNSMTISKSHERNSENRKKKRKKSHKSIHDPQYIEKLRKERLEREKDESIRQKKILKSM